MFRPRILISIMDREPLPGWAFEKLRTCDVDIVPPNAAPNRKDLLTRLPGKHGLLLTGYQLYIYICVLVQYCTLYMRCATCKCKSHNILQVQSDQSDKSGSFKRSWKTRLEGSQHDERRVITMFSIQASLMKAYYRLFD